MASPIKRYISGRRKKSSSLPDLKHVIARKLVSRLNHASVGIIGNDRTGRNTLVRRFLDMSGGEFDDEERERYNCRSVLVDLSERPSMRYNEVVNLTVYILNLPQLDFAAIHLIVTHLNSFAVVFDVGSDITFYTAIYCMVKITELLQHKTPRFILVGNKIDLLHHEVIPPRAFHAAVACEAQGYYICSALKNFRMDDVLDALLLMAFHPFSSLP